MSESFLQNLFAERIGGRNYGKNTQIYKFEKIKRAKRAATAAHPGIELIDLGVGEPDEMAFPLSVQTLQAEAARPENRGYADNGGPEYRQAAARWMKNVCGVDLNPETEILHSLGSKAALSLLPATLINPGDVAIMTVPGYPVFGTHTKWYGGEVFNLKLTKKNNFLPNFAEIPDNVLRRAKAMVLNYPNNPTGASATREFFTEAVAFAKKHNLVIVSDAAYAALVFEGKPLSILSIPGAKDVAVELHSMSKGFNMTGWRLGFVAGNELLVKAYGDVKDNTDSGQFLAIQKACAASLDHPEITQQIAAKYSRRMDLLVAMLRRFGFDANKPKGSFFLYVQAPSAVITANGSRREFASAEDVSQWLITEKLISTVPWDDAGPYLRFSATFIAKGEADERRVVDEIARRFDGLKFEFGTLPEPPPTPQPIALSERERVSNYIIEFQKRYPEFMEARRQYLRDGGASSTMQYFIEYLWLAGRQTYEEMLMGMLNDKEQELLRADPTLTEAWRKFIEMKWTQKRINTTILLFLVVVVLPLLIIGAGWAALESMKSATTIGK